MKYLVITEDPMVLNHITLNNKCVIKSIPEEEGIGEEAEFVVEEGNSRLDFISYTCPKCGCTLGSYRRLKFCANCGLKNKEADDEVR